MGITVSGTSITFNDATVQTTAGGTVNTTTVLAATAGASAGAVGTYTASVISVTSTIVVGATVAGSNLRGVTAAGSYVSPGFSGTWRNMGCSESTTAGYSAAIPLFLRIS